MYNKLLENVVRVISKTAKVADDSSSSNSDFYNMMFAPEEYEKQIQRRKKIEKIQNASVAVVTGVAVIGEIYHIVKKRNS